MGWPTGESAPRGGSRDARGSPAALCPHSRLGVDGGVEASCRRLQVRLRRFWSGIRHPQCALHACIGNACRPSGSAPQRGPRGEEHGVLCVHSQGPEGLRNEGPFSLRRGGGRAGGVEGAGRYTLAPASLAKKDWPSERESRGWKYTLLAPKALRALRIRVGRVDSPGFGGRSWRIGGRPPRGEEVSKGRAKERKGG